MYLHGRLPQDWGDMSHLSSRQDDGGGGDNGGGGGGGGGGGDVQFIIIGVILAILLISAVIAVLMRGSRKKRRAGQKQTEQGRDSAWKRVLSPFRSKGGRYQATSGEDGAELNQTTSTASRDVEQAPSGRTNRQNTTAGATVDRNTSVRSVLTLPPYSLAASQNEQVIGREGERDGVDVIVDYPTEEHEEELREQEMAALYQLRVTRRQQNAEREELRRQRREARDRHDVTALNDIRNRARTASNSNNSLVEELRRDIDRAKENRQRSVSSVSYADLGVARHDGTRIRANSQESERMGLLSDAADMGAQGARSGANSPAFPAPHRRDASATSIISMDNDFPSPALTHSRRNSGSVTPRLSNGGRAGSSPELVESDLGVESMPPPEYEDVPLDEEAQRSTTPLHEPPPDYPGPYRSNSQRSHRSHRSQLSQSSQQDHPVSSNPADDGGQPPRGRGVGGVPQLPSLRIGRLPSIRIEPSSAHPRDDDDDEPHSNLEQRR